LLPLFLDILVLAWIPLRVTFVLTLNLLMGPVDLLPFFGAAILHNGLFDPGPKCPWDYLIYPRAISILLTYYLWVLPLDFRGTP
jgi:hypothetical protein